MYKRIIHHLVTNEWAQDVNSHEFILLISKKRVINSKFLCYFNKPHHTCSLESKFCVLCEWRIIWDWRIILGLIALLSVYTYQHVHGDIDPLVCLQHSLLQIQMSTNYKSVTSLTIVHNLHDKYYNVCSKIFWSFFIKKNTPVKEVQLTLTKGKISKI